MPFYQIKPGPSVETQRLVWMFFQVFAHDANALFHQFVAGSDKRWQKVSTARFFIGFLHNFQRFNADGFCGIVKLHAAAAV